MSDVNNELLLNIQEALQNGADAESTNAKVIDLLEEAGYPFDKIEDEEEEFSQPEGSVMWEIEVPVLSWRTYHVPGKSEIDAMDFFSSPDFDPEVYSSFDDVLDGEKEEEATVKGVSPASVEYMNDELWRKHFGTR